MIKDNINKALEEEPSLVQIINKPLKLQTVNEGTKEDDILVRGSDNTVKYVSQSSLGGGSTISVTKSELDNLISNNSLIPGAYYKISGVHPALYDDGTSSGTTIYLRAATNNKLEKNGHGEFWNPRYDQSVDGFGIYGALKNKIDLVQTNFKRVISWNSNYGRPQDMLFDSTSQIIYAWAYNNNKIQKSGPGINAFSTFSANINDVVIDSNDNLYVVLANNTLHRVEPNGTINFIKTLDVLSSKAMVIDSNNDLFIIGPKRISKIVTSTGIETEFATGGEFSDICIDSFNNIYTVDISIQSLIRFTADGTSTIIFYGTVSTIVNIGMDDCIYLTGFDENRFVVKFNSYGTLISLYEMPNTVNDINADSNGKIYVTIAGYFIESIIRIDEFGTIRPFSQGSAISGKIIIKDLDEVYIMAYIEAYTWVLNSHIILPFIDDEFITANNDSTGKLIGNINNGNFIPLSGDWNSATSIKGDISKSTTIIKSIDLLTISVGDKTIWGGYSWTNNSGTIGQYYDQFTLSYDWTKDQYNEDNYKPVLDIIEYDYSNDTISRRYEIQSGNDVIYNRSDYDNFGRESAIKAFQFGNPFNSNFYKGVSNIAVSHSYFENINFTGSYQKSIILDSAEQSNCIFGPNSYQEYLTFSGGSGQQNVEFKNNSGQTQCTFKEGSSSGNYLIPSDSTMSNLSLLKNSSIYNIPPYEDSLLLNPSISKEIYNRPDGTTKIRYYDNDDNLVISDIND
ncbi:hypothetical protein C8C83_3320 [Flavobacterium sp. 90]|uniref:hypothetical protein n=1 Tax=unclassified Flavobacterium TaxID=196869 RepID=UPI000EAD25F8|nr:MULTISPECIES: hypothetical protein [unclassified Flavobacterium]RKR11580.1 hypothetical protein C8C82_3631 [Flavobacterium sp. 81]TCK55361.1 hypothetical protein C8C83_3320 [Flavobacterium sp. 90]